MSLVASVNYDYLAISWLLGHSFFTPIFPIEWNLFSNIASHINGSYTTDLKCCKIFMEKENIFYQYPYWIKINWPQNYTMKCVIDNISNHNWLNLTSECDFKTIEFCLCLRSQKIIHYIVLLQINQFKVLTCLFLSYNYLDQIPVQCDVTEYFLCKIYGSCS
jgi:hypothetical protein